MAHQKHTKLVKPAGGKFGRNEIAIMGAPCGEIKSLVSELVKSQHKNWNMAYVDQEHNAPEAEGWTAVQDGAIVQYNDKIAFGQFDTKPNEHTDLFFHAADLVLINGNHYKAQNQIIYVHPKKTIEHKLDRLTNVLGIILDDTLDDIPAYLKNHFGTDMPQVIKRENTWIIEELISNFLAQRKPVLKGLVLTGGKSTRMNRDKSVLDYHGKPQQEYLYELLSEYCDEVYYSVRDEAQAGQVPGQAIADTFAGLGPYGGILSAFRADPNAAWFTVAVDLPYLDKATVEQLINERNIHKTATCFIDRNDEYPEPLITIWEPRAYPELLKWLGKGYSCPRKVLLNSNSHVIVDRDVKALTNVNTPDEYEHVKTELGVK